jgi:hypothetical protein
MFENQYYVRADEAGGKRLPAQGCLGRASRQRVLRRGSLASLFGPTTCCGRCFAPERFRGLPWLLEHYFMQSSEYGFPRRPPLRPSEKGAR